MDTIHTDVVHSVAWNWSGNLLATVAKDKKIRVIDPRANQVVQSGEAHQGVKASRVVWLGQLNKLASTGFGKMRDRQFAIWDASNLSKPLVMNSVDSSTGVLDIFYGKSLANIIGNSHLLQTMTLRFCILLARLFCSTYFTAHGHCRATLV